MFDNMQSYLVHIFCTIFLLLITACSSSKVLLDVPTFDDNIPELLTGFYTVTSEEDSSNFMGDLVYLYKDDTFIDGKYFAGIKGSFLPNNYIKTKLVNNEVQFYWQNADDDSQNGLIEFQEITKNKLIAKVYDENGNANNYNFSFYKHHIWKEDVKTISIAHRGMCYQPPFNYDGIFPANSSPGFEAALRSGYGGFELDVRITKDKRFVISHDEDLSAATTLHGEVKNKNLSDFDNALIIKSAAIPENKRTAKEAYIAAPMRSLNDVLYHFIDDPRLKTFVVDIKPDTDENIYAAAKHDFEGLSEERQKKVLFLTRNESTAKILKKFCPFSDIALEGPKGVEPVDELNKFFPEAVDLPRGSHNTVSFGSNWILTFQSIETSSERIGKVMNNAEKYNYKVCMWTFAKEWRINFLREYNFLPDFILCDVPYYQFALQQLRYTKEKDKKIIKSENVAAKYSNPIYKRAYKQYVRNFWFQSRTMIELSYGFGKPNYSGFHNSFAPIGNLEIKVGRSELDKFSKQNILLSEWYLFFGYMNSDISIQDISSNEITTSFSKFGFGMTEGFGYGESTFSFIPYVSQSLGWTKLNDFSDYLKPAEGEDPSDDYNTLNRYWGTFRFGDRAVYGLKMDIMSSFEVFANYETSVIYPRHLFAKWAGSYLLMQVGYNALTYYTGKLVDDNPTIGPIINFLISSLYLYGYYSLRKTDMNWPFSTETPLRYEIINFGVSFMF